jgi:hypothetical protein
MNFYLKLVSVKREIGAEVFNELVTFYCKHELPDKMVGFVSDGAPAVVGKKKVVAAKLRNKVREFQGSTSFFSFHFKLHHEGLCAKSLKMNHVMDAVNTTVNFICTRALNDLEFVGLLEEI